MIIPVKDESTADYIMNSMINDIIKGRRSKIRISKIKKIFGL